MRNVFFADLMTCKNPWWLYCGGAAGLLAALNQYQDKVRFGDVCPMDETLTTVFLFAGFLICLFCGLFAGSEAENGGLRRQVIAGHSRTKIYLAHLLFTLLAGVSAAAAYLLFNIVPGLLLLDAPKSTLGPTMVRLCLGTLTLAAFAALFHMIAMLAGNRARALLLCILVFLGMLMLAALIEGRLEAPETISAYTMTVDGVQEVASEPNPRYLSPAARQACQFVMMLLPAGQALQLTMGGLPWPWLAAVCSLLVTAGTTLAGVCFFRKKDLK